MCVYNYAYICTNIARRLIYCLWMSAYGRAGGSLQPWEVASGPLFPLIVLTERRTSSCRGDSLGRFLLGRLVTSSISSNVVGSVSVANVRPEFGLLRGKGQGERDKGRRSGWVCSVDPDGP